MEILKIHVMQVSEIEDNIFWANLYDLLLLASASVQEW